MKTCVTCGSEFLPKRKDGVKCSDCRGKRTKTGKCECGSAIFKHSKSCAECANLKKRGAGNHNYKGRYVNYSGYVVLNSEEYRNHPNAWKTGQILEHVKVMSHYLGRPLRDGEEVHHKNGIRSDNRIENLELWTRSHPTGVRVTDLYTWATEFIEQYHGDIHALG